MIFYCMLAATQWARYEKSAILREVTLFASNQCFFNPPKRPVGYALWSDDFFSKNLDFRCATHHATIHTHICEIVTALFFNF